MRRARGVRGVRVCVCADEEERRVVFEEEDEEVERTMTWLQRVVIGHELCPFAKPALPTTRCVSVAPRGEAAHARTAALLRALESEARCLVESYESDVPTVTTTLLVVRGGFLDDFADFMEFVHAGERLLETTAGLEAKLQLVPFHPRATFDDVAASRGASQADAHLASDPADFTARSPYPTVHLLVEDDVSAALDRWRAMGHSPHDITAKNLKRLRRMGRETLRRQFVDAIFADDNDNGMAKT